MSFKSDYIKYEPIHDAFDPPAERTEAKSSAIKGYITKLAFWVPLILLVCLASFDFYEKVGIHRIAMIPVTGTVRPLGGKTTYLRMTVTPRNQLHYETYNVSPKAWKNPLYTGPPSHESHMAWNRLQAGSYSTESTLRSQKERN